jgi:hypothetical protein
MSRRLLLGLVILTAACATDETRDLGGSGDECSTDLECGDGERCVFTGPGCTTNVKGRCSTYACDDDSALRIYCACVGRRPVYGDSACSPEQYIREQTTAMPCSGVVRDSGP